MKLVYIASPYHADTAEEMEQNLKKALEYCEYAASLGRLTGETIVPITPLVNFPYLNENNPAEREQALKMGLSLLTKCDEIWVGGDRVSEGMRGELRAACRIGMPILTMEQDPEKRADATKRVQDAVSDLPSLLTEKQCFKNSDKRNYTGQLLILKPEVLTPWCREPESQLWIAEHGNGVRPDARGRAVYAKCLMDGEEARWDRSDFYGVANPNRLPSWATEKLSELQQEHQNNDELEEQEQ